MFFKHVKSLFFREKESEPSPDIVVLGIGNIGNQYLNTRHNIGFDVVEATALHYSSSFSLKRAFKADVSTLMIGEKKVLLIKPRTYVNLSGESLSAVLSQYGLTVDNVIVVVDDFHLPLGTVRIRRSGSHGGHNGLKSIMSEVGDKFTRIRVGIGPLPEKSSVIDFVLGKFTENEEMIKKKVVKYSVEALSSLVEKGEEFAISRFNGKVN